MQILSLPYCISSTPNVSASLPWLTPFCPSHHQSLKSVSNPIQRNGFCNSLKRVSESQTDWRNHGGFVSIRCEVVKDDGFYMRRCVEVARKAIGCTSPNPMVGCVIVKDGEIVGEGFHPKAGQPHAEVFALREAGELAENATAYVSLEPCNHYGRTPPCSEALIKAKLKKVVVGMVDPNPIVASRGVDKLRDAGIEVTVGVEEELCKRLNEAYIHQMLTEKPFLTLRYSLSVNGHVIDQHGEGVTESGGYYSQLLQEYDAVILSPASLTDKLSIPASKELGAKQPLKIIVAKSPSSPIQISGLSTVETSEVIIFTDKETVVEPDLAQKGIETVVMDGINLDSILNYCKQRGFCSVLLDLRGNFENIEELLKEGIEKNMLQKLVIEVLPVWDKSDGGNSLEALKSLGRRFQVKKLQPKISKQCILLEGYL